MWTHGQMLVLKSHKVLGLPPSYKDLEAARMSHTQKQSLEVMTLPENLRALAKLLLLDL